MVAGPCGVEYPLYKATPGQMTTSEFGSGNFNAAFDSDAWARRSEPSASAPTLTANNDGAMKVLSSSGYGAHLYCGRHLKARIPGAGYEAAMKYTAIIKADSSSRLCIGLAAGFGLIGTSPNRGVGHLAYVGFDGNTAKFLIAVCKNTNGYENLPICVADDTYGDNLALSPVIANFDPTLYNTYEILIVVSRGIYSGVRALFSLNGRLVYQSGIVTDLTNDFLDTYSTMGAHPHIGIAATSKNMWIRYVSLARM